MKLSRLNNGARHRHPFIFNIFSKLYFELEKYLKGTSRKKIFIWYIFRENHNLCMLPTMLFMLISLMFFLEIAFMELKCVTIGLHIIYFHWKQIRSCWMIIYIVVCVLHVKGYEPIRGYFRLDACLQNCGVKENS